MRNWLRKWLWGDTLDKLAAGFHEDFCTLTSRLNDEVDAGVAADNAILKRLLAVEVTLGLAPNEDPLRVTMYDSLRLAEGRIDAYRKEVEAVKAWQEKSDEDDRLCRGGIVLPDQPLTFVLARDHAAYRRHLTANKLSRRNVLYIGGREDILGDRIGTNLIKIEGWQKNPNYDLKFRQALMDRVDPSCLSTEELRMDLPDDADYIANGKNAKPPKKKSPAKPKKAR